ncbi:hypothetical protein [Streptomyces sp. NPDC001492]
MSDSLDDLEREAQSRKGRGRGRNAGASRNPRNTQDPDEATRRREELERARLAREQRRQQEEEERRRREAEQPPGAGGGDEGDPVPPSPPEEVQGEESGSRGRRKRETRPKSMPFYPNPEHDAFLWRVTEAASARQKRIPATAVLRLALSRLEQQMTPSEIVQALGSADQPDGRMGRPRL